MLTCLVSAQSREHSSTDSAFHHATVAASHIGRIATQGSWKYHSGAFDCGRMWPINEPIPFRGVPLVHSFPARSRIAKLRRQGVKRAIHRNHVLPTNIKNVDFRNFKYLVDGNTFNGRYFRQQWVQLRRGGYEIWSPDHSYRKHYVRFGFNETDDIRDGAYPQYGDLTGDGLDDAVVLITSGGDETYIYYQVFVYTMQQGRIRLFADFHGGFLGSSTSIVGTSIDRGLLRIERGNEETPIATRYHWNGKRFEISN